MSETLYMQRAIYLASLADEYRVQMNPKVGAVLVYKDRIIGEGYHQEAGKPHAEVNCLESVSPQDQIHIPESTMYVTLEPCAHEGKTPSCAKRLVAERVPRVVMGTLDPFPSVAGRGAQILRDAGIEVEVGMLEEECKELAKVFMVNQLERRPFITLKWAESADGFIDHKREYSKPAAQISTPFIQILTHRMRGAHMGIMVGKGTIIADRPQLNNRLWPLLPSPKVYVLDRSAETLSYVKERKGWQLIDDSTDLKALFEQIYREGINSVLVEGGATLLTALIEAGLWDELRREISPIQLTEGVPAPKLPPSVAPLRSHTLARHTLLYYQNSHPITTAKS